MSFLRFGTNRHCDPATLEAVVREEATSKELDRATEHLAGCAVCQQRLMEISAVAPWWDELPRMLTAPSEDTCDFQDQYSLGAQAEFVVKRLVESGLIAKDDTASIGRLDRYQLEETLGLGGTGIVFRAKDVELGRVVAVKVLSPDLALSNAARRRFAREGQACAAVAHENVVAIHHVHSTRNVPYLVMQYVDGVSLDQIVAKAGPLDAPEALRIISQVAAGLSAAHERGIVHRDVKPANVLIESAGQRAWISDFGLARAVDDVGLTRTGFVAGTPHYMSPEQARGGSVCVRSDLFSLGSVLYFMLTGQPPFRAEKTLAVLNRICESKHTSVRQLNPSVPIAVSALVDSLLAKSPEERPQSADEVFRRCVEVSGSLEHIGVSAEMVPSERVVRRGKYRQLLAWTGLLLVCGGLSWWAYSSREAIRRSIGRDRHAIVGGQVEEDLSPMESWSPNSEGPHVTNPMHFDDIDQANDVGPPARPFAGRLPAMNPSTGPLPPSTAGASANRRSSASLGGFSELPPQDFSANSDSSLDLRANGTPIGQPENAATEENRFDVRSGRWNREYEELASKIQELQQLTHPPSFDVFAPAPNVESDFDQVMRDIEQTIAQFGNRSGETVTNSGPQAAQENSFSDPPLGGNQ